MFPQFPLYKDGTKDINLFTNPFGKNSLGAEKTEIKKMQSTSGDMRYLLLQERYTQTNYNKIQLEIKLSLKQNAVGGLHCLS